MSTNAWSRLRSWMRTPPVMERTLEDDVKVAAGVLVGVALACLLGLAQWTAVPAAAVGLVIATAALNAVRRVRSRRAQ